MSLVGRAVGQHASAVTYPLAELDRRFYAFVVDRVLTGLVYGAVAALGWLLARDVWTCVALVGAAMVLTWLALGILLGVTGTSPGKSLVGLRVVNQGTGTPIGVGSALLRGLVLGLATAPTFALGLVTLAWTAVADPSGQRRGWHDHLAHSVVVDVRPPGAQPDTVEEGPRHVVNLTALRLIPAPPVETHAMPRRATPETQAPQARPPGPAPTPPVPVQQPPVQAAPAPSPPPASFPPPDDGRTVVRPRPGAAPATPPRDAAPATPTWRVVFDDGTSFVVEGLVLVGRRPEPRAGEQAHRLVPLSSGDMSVSKTHAQFGPAPDGALVVMDRGSTNGSVLRRKGVARPLAAGKPTTLVDGDTVSFGDRSMLVRREG